MSSQNSLPSLEPSGSPGISSHAFAHWERRRIIHNLLANYWIADEVYSFVPSVH